MTDQRFYLPPRKLRRNAQYLPFKPTWLNKLKRPILSYGYYVLISHSAHQSLASLNTYQKLIISQILYSLACNPRPSQVQRVTGNTDHYCMSDARSGFSLHYRIRSGRVYVMDIVGCGHMPTGECCSMN